MRVMIGLALLLLFMPPSAVAATSTPLEFGATALVDVDATGKAHVVEMQKVSTLEDVPSLAPIVERIKGRLKDAIESWQFVPAMQDGIAVRSQTHVVVQLEGTDDGAGGMAVRVRSAAPGAGMRRMDMSRLQAAVTMAQAEGFVTLDLTYDATGKVVGSELVDSKALSDAGFTGKADKELRRGALAESRTWELDPELVDGHPRSGSGRITLIFCLSPRCGTTPLPGEEGPDPQQFASNDPAVKLRSNVAGTGL